MRARSFPAIAAAGLAAVIGIGAAASAGGREPEQPPPTAIDGTPFACIAAEQFITVDATLAADARGRGTPDEAASEFAATRGFAVRSEAASSTYVDEAGRPSGRSTARHASTFVDENGDTVLELTTEQVLGTWVVGGIRGCQSAFPPPPPIPPGTSEELEP